VIFRNSKQKIFRSEMNRTSVKNWVCIHIVWEIWLFIDL